MLEIPTGQGPSTGSVEIALTKWRPAAVEFQVPEKFIEDALVHRVGPDRPRRAVARKSNERPTIGSFRYGIQMESPYFGDGVGRTAGQPPHACDLQRFVDQGANIAPSTYAHSMP